MQVITLIEPNLFIKERDMMQENWLHPNNRNRTIVR
jgi:hypothetical protein